MSDFDLKCFEVSGSTGIDALFQREPALVRPRIRVASCRDLAAFTRVSEDTLVHKSDRDLWALRREADGKYYIERMFDDASGPLKG